MYPAGIGATDKAEVRLARLADSTSIRLIAFPEEFNKMINKYGAHDHLDDGDQTNPPELSTPPTTRKTKTAGTLVTTTGSTTLGRSSTASPSEFPHCSLQMRMIRLTVIMVMATLRVCQEARVDVDVHLLDGLRLLCENFFIEDVRN